MNTMTLSINGTNLTNFIRYPISYTFKSLDESLSILEFTLFATEIQTPFKPNTIAEVLIKNENEDVLLDGFMVVSGDTIERVGVTNKYHHKISLVELTYLLSLEILPDMSITRVSVVDPDQIGEIYEPTLADVVDKILKYSEGTFSKTLIMATGTRNRLAAIQAPELTMTRYTTLEALRLVFGIAKLVPYCRYNNLLQHLDVTNIAATGLNTYVAKNEAFNADQFRTKLYSPVENFIGGGDLQGSIVEPANAWITARGENGTDISNDSAVWRTQKPIYKIEKLEVPAFIYYNKRRLVGGVDYHELIFVRIETINPLWVNNKKGLDITQNLLEKSSYDLLENTQDGKGSKIFYEQGSQLINGLSNRPESWSQFFDPTYQAIKEVLSISTNYWNESSNIGEYINPTYITDLTNYLANIWNQQYPGITATFESIGIVPQGLPVVQAGLPPLNQDVYKRTITRSGAGDQFVKPFRTADFNGGLPYLHALLARITYTPYINTKLFTYKERKETGDPIHETTMFYNQSANTIADDTLAELHDKVIKRGNAPTQTIKKLHTNINSIPFIGRLVDNYVITAEDMTINADNINVEYILSKDYAKLNQYVAVLEKYRQFSIPSERVVDRQFTINEFAKFSRTQQSRTAVMQIADYAGTLEPNLMLINTSGMYKFPDGVTDSTPQVSLATTNFAFNNALVFEANMGTNSTAFSESVEFRDQNDDLVLGRRIERPIPYTNNVGYVQTITNFQLVTNISSTFSQIDAYEYPILEGETYQEIHLTKINIPIDKDARERLSFAYMLHHIDETGLVYINRGWTQRNGLIGGAGIKTGLRFVYFNLRPIDGNPAVSNYAVVGANPNANITNDTVRVTITHTAVNVPNANYWGIIDENNDLLFWVNEPCVAGTAPAPLYINFRSTY